MHRGNWARVAAFRMYVCVFVIRFALCTSVTPCAMAFIPVRVCRTIKETRHRNCKSWTMMQNEKGGKMYVSRSRMKSDDVLFIRSMQISLSQSLSLSLFMLSFPIYSFHTLSMTRWTIWLMALVSSPEHYRWAAVFTIRTHAMQRKMHIIHVMSIEKCNVVTNLHCNAMNR